MKEAFVGVTTYKRSILFSRRNTKPWDQCAIPQYTDTPTSSHGRLRRYMSIGDVIWTASASAWPRLDFNPPDIPHNDHGCL